MGEVIPGPWPPQGWKRGGLDHLSTTEARRASILSSKPRCACCEVPFSTGYAPRDGLCRLCRADIERNTSPDDPALF